MFDYPTHKDFGSGDRVCYHGVMDAFRNPKPAAALYASQGNDMPVLEVGSPMDIGDYAGGLLGDMYVFTNADELRLYKNDKYVATFRPRGWRGLEHGPVPVDDTIGCLLETEEGFSGAKERLLRSCLVSAGKHGLANMPLMDKLKMAWCMLRYGLSFADGVALYGKYVSNWGSESTRWRFDGIKNGELFASKLRCPGNELSIKLRVSHTELVEKDSYDMAAVRISIVDENGNPAPYAQLPVSLKAEGDIALVGPGAVCAEGGMCGCYVKSLGRSGSGSLLVSTEQTESVEIRFSIDAEEDKK